MFVVRYDILTTDAVLHPWSSYVMGALQILDVIGYDKAAVVVVFMYLTLAVLLFFT